MKTYLSIWAAIFFISYVFIIVFSGGGWSPFAVNWNFENSGQFGDSFGPLTSLFSAFAAVSAFLAYRTQRQQLDDAKKIIESDKAETAKRDFEGTFFRMLEFFRAVVRDAKSGTTNQPHFGVEAFQYIVSLNYNYYSENKKQDIISSYTLNYKNHNNQLSHYFRLAYHILKYIDDSQISDKMLYARIFRANLSNSELVLLGLNAAYGAGKDKFLPLMEKYRILHNISAGDAQQFFLIEELPSMVFGDRDLVTELQSR